MSRHFIEELGRRSTPHGQQMIIAINIESAAAIGLIGFNNCVVDDDLLHALVVRQRALDAVKELARALKAIRDDSVL